MDYFFEGHWRMDWGFGNPNKTAALIAMLMVGSWIFAYLWKRGFWLSLVSSGILGGCLICTYSRGGLVAAIFGLLAVVAFAPRPWPKYRMIAVIITIVGLITFSYHTSAVKRYFKGVTTTDVSIENRLEIWSKAPRMMVDAPGGWGFGNSGDAYVQWYQPLERTERYRTLVSSHLTWLVEMGWLGRAGYAFIWSSALLICYPIKKENGIARSGLPLGVWISWAAASFFSSVAESIILWIPSLLFLLWMLSTRTYLNLWPGRTGKMVVLISFISICLMFFALGKFMPSPFQVSAAPDEVEVQLTNKYEGSPKSLSVLILDPDVRVLGEHYGHDLRKMLLESPLPSKGRVGRILVGRFPKLDFEPDLIVLSGSISREQAWKAKKLVILNPKGSIETWKNLKLSSGTTAKIYWGEFWNSGETDEWRKEVETQPRVAFVQVRGAGEYLYQWPTLVFSDQNNE